MKERGLSSPPDKPGITRRARSRKPSGIPGNNERENIQKVAINIVACGYAAVRRRYTASAGEQRGLDNIKAAYEYLLDVVGERREE
jgi:hypothetical protein